MPVNRLTRLFAALALLVLASPAGAVLEIEITEGATGARPIAVVPFGWQGEGEAPADLARIISNDLTRSGQFAPLERRNHVAQPTRADGIRFGNWRTLGADHIVIGRVQPRADAEGYRVQFQLFDVVRQQQVVGYSFTAGEGALRGLAHEISDSVYQEITGERGAFSTQIAFVSAQGEGDERRFRLKVADYDGYNARTILRSRQPIMSPAWGPDGERIAYVSFEGGRSAVYVQQVATGQRREVSARAGINGAPAWGPGGDRLAVTLSQGGDADIYVIGLNGGGKQRVTRSGGIDTSPAWAPDGQTLVFTSDRAGAPQLYSVPVDAAERPQRLTFDGNYNADPSVSPSGERLAFVHRTQSDQYRLAVLDRTSDLTQIVSKGRLDESPTFAPNGRMVLYATEYQGQGALGLVSTGGRAAARLSEGQGDIREPAWGPFPE
jgi:TolB protein